MSNSKTISKVFSILIHPFSPVTTLIMSFLITLLATGKDVPDSIGYLIENKKILVLILVIWFVFSIFYSFFSQKIEEKDNEIMELKTRISEKDNQIKQNSGAILNKYGELAKFNKKNKFHDCLKSFVDNNIGVECAQIYKYTTSLRGSSIKIKLTYEEGFSSEDIDINVLLQSYYTVETDIYKKLYNIQLLWNKLYTSDQLGQIEEDTLNDKLLEEIAPLLTHLINELNAITDEANIKEMHYVYYQISLILISILNSDDGLSNYDFIMNNEQIETVIKNGKRTGILGAILSSDLYIFKHTGHTKKNGRTYLCFPFTKYNENYVVLIVISPSSIVNKFNQFLKNLKDDFIMRLELTD